MNANNKKTSFIVVCAVYAACILLIPFINYLRNLTGDLNFPPKVPGVRYPTLLLFLVFFAAYWCYLRLRASYFPARNWTLYGSLVLFLGLYACTIYPIFSIDLYEYIIRGRIWSLYHANPFLHPPSDFKEDLFYPIIFWTFQPTPYGPLWAWITWLPTKLSGNSVFINQFLMKIVLFIFYLLSALQVYRLAKMFDLKKPVIFAEAFLLNPFMVVSILVDGHNDIVMVFFLLWSLVELKKGRDLRSLVLLTLSILAKYVTGIFLPLYAAYYYMKYKGMAKKAFFALKASVLCLAIAIIIFRPFWVGSKTFAGIMSAASSFHDNTITYVIYRITALIARGLSIESFMVVSKVTFLAFCIIILTAFLKSKREAKDLVKAMAIILAGYFCLGSFQFGSWYLVWLAPLIIISGFPMAFLLQSLLTFAALISFWKRVSLLLIAAAFVYLAIQKTGIFNSLFSIKEIED